VTSAATSGGQALASFDVTNTGSRAGAEVAQVYVGAPPVNPVGEPQKQLRGFQKVQLAPGETRHLAVPIDSRAVDYWNTSVHNWTAEAGCHPVLVGSSSRDIRLQGVGLDGNIQACGAGTSAPVLAALPNTGVVAPLGGSSVAVGGRVIRGSASIAAGTGVALLGAALVVFSLAFMLGTGVFRRRLSKTGPPRSS
jgi:beta-glucosidase